MGVSKTVYWYAIFGAAFVGFIVATTIMIFAAQCEVDVTPETWVKTMGAEQREGHHATNP